MMTEYRVKGALFVNNKGGPGLAGFIEIDGVKTHFACWGPKVSAAGTEYYQISEDKKQQQKYDAKQGNAQQAPVRSPFQPKPPMPRAAPAPAARQYARDPEMDDDIPF